MVTQLPSLFWTLWLSVQVSSARTLCIWTIVQICLKAKLNLTQMLQWLKWSEVMLHFKCRGDKMFSPHVSSLSKMISVFRRKNRKRGSREDRVWVRSHPLQVICQLLWAPPHHLRPGRHPVRAHPASSSRCPSSWCQTQDHRPRDWRSVLHPYSDSASCCSPSLLALLLTGPRSHRLFLP